jgi:hypothetical protein
MISDAVMQVPDDNMTQSLVEQNKLSARTTLHRNIEHAYAANAVMNVCSTKQQCALCQALHAHVMPAVAMHDKS